MRITAIVAIVVAGLSAIPSEAQADNVSGRVVSVTLTSESGSYSATALVRRGDGTYFSVNVIQEIFDGLQPASAGYLQRIVVAMSAPSTSASFYNVASYGSSFYVLHRSSALVISK